MIFFFLIFSTLLKNYSFLGIEVSDFIKIQAHYAVCSWNAFCPRFCTNNIPAPLSLLLLLNEYILKPTYVSPQTYFSQLFLQILSLHST